MLTCLLGLSSSSLEPSFIMIWSCSELCIVQLFCLLRGFSLCPVNRFGWLLLGVRHSAFAIPGSTRSASTKNVLQAFHGANKFSATPGGKRAPPKCKDRCGRYPLSRVLYKWCQYLFSVFPWVTRFFHHMSLGFNAVVTCTSII